MTEYFVGPRKKLDRAETHVDELNQALMDFIATKPYRINYQLNSDQTFYECRIYYGDRAPPIEIGILVGEIVYQLRSILDHIIFHFSIPKLLQISDRKAQIKAAEIPQFPILAERNDRIFNRYLKFVEKPVRDAVGRYQPYDRTYSPEPANHPLALLSRLNNADKHRITPMTVGALRLMDGEVLSPGVEMQRGRDVKDGEIIATVAAHLDPKKHFGPNLTAEILLHNSREPNIVRPIGNVVKMYHFIRDELLPCFTNVAAQLGGGTESEP